MYHSCAARLGQAFAIDARHDKATVLLDEACLASASSGSKPSDRGSEARALLLLAELALRSDTLDLAHDLGERPIVAHCHFDLGRLDHRAGRREEAREHLTAATTMYRENGHALLAA
jgi:thioredoxin-like negative regulator of GroEL